MEQLEETIENKHVSQTCISPFSSGLAGFAASVAEFFKLSLLQCSSTSTTYNGSNSPEFGCWGHRKNRSITVTLNYQQEWKEKAWCYLILKVCNDLLLFTEYQLSPAVYSKNYRISIDWEIPHTEKHTWKNYPFSILPHQCSLKSNCSFRCFCLCFYMQLFQSKANIFCNCTAKNLHHTSIIELCLFFKKKQILGTSFICRFAASSFSPQQRSQKDLSSITACICSKQEAATCRPHLYTPQTALIMSDIHLKNTNMQIWWLKTIVYKAITFIIYHFKKQWH